MLTEYEQIQAKDKAAEERRQRAWEIDKWTKDRDRVTARVSRLEKILGQPDPTIVTLNSIATLVLDLPSGLEARGSRFMPGGFELKELLTMLIDNARSVAAAKRERLEAELPEAKKTLDQLNSTLAAATKS